MKQIVISLVEQGQPVVMQGAEETTAALGICALVNGIPAQEKDFSIDSIASVLMSAYLVVARDMTLSHHIGAATCPVCVMHKKCIDDIEGRRKELRITTLNTPE